ncbi:M78 family (ImmA) [Fructobacillus fructosus]|uniref:M78 family (ImmA) n=1 Tax=Fructobacillus fructosus TaxID=1631 RepID=A0ABM9MLD6_9LACO|nr:M78 family (ImmA) [Fructobacillus fructosus]CAK1234560.1 M78 family (ImmA) [Fructobacillus fructosus]
MIEDYFVDSYLYEEIEESLKKIATKNDIKVLNVDDVKSNVPDTTWPSIKAIMMNINFYTKVSYQFRLAHELSHLLYGDTSLQDVYQFSEFGKRGEELLAHKNAIKMLMEVERPTNVQSFMEFYDVPSWLFDYVEAEYSLQG